MSELINHIRAGWSIAEAAKADGISESEARRKIKKAGGIVRICGTAWHRRAAMKRKLADQILERHFGEIISNFESGKTVGQIMSGITGQYSPEWRRRHKSILPSDDAIAQICAHHQIEAQRVRASEDGRAKS